MRCPLIVHVINSWLVWRSTVLGNSSEVIVTKRTTVLYIVLNLILRPRLRIMVRWADSLGVGAVERVVV